LPYVLGAGVALVVWLAVRHINGRRAPILIGLLVALLIAGGVVEVRHRQMESRYTAATKELLDRKDTYIVCERMSGAMLNVWNRAGYVEWTQDGSKPDRADLTWDTCRYLRGWERSGMTAADLDHVMAVHVLTHEAMHLNGHYNEADAECMAMQRDSEMAQLLGATPEQADALAKVYWTTVYPRMRADYITSECRPKGTLDQSPGDGHWP
jgi:hypothetical protein